LIVAAGTPLARASSDIRKSSLTRSMITRKSHFSLTEAVGARQQRGHRRSAATLLSAPPRRVTSADVRTDVLRRRPGITGHTLRMKVAISLPDDLFERVDQCAKRLRVPRSRLLADGARRIVAKYSAKDATAAWNSVLEAANQVRDASEEATVAILGGGRSWCGAPR
jgi:predicted transcriptional regulator